MNAIYHQQVMQRALGERVSDRALKAMVAANLGQDTLLGLLRTVRHFDDNLLAEGLAYMAAERAAAAAAERREAAWAAFGRLAHTAQDFYSHSNYVALWLEGQASQAAPPVDSIDGLDAALLQHPRLRTGRVYLPLEALWLFPRLQPWLKRVLPPDSHAHMNLDSPETGALFPYSLEAAVQRTRAEFDLTLEAICKQRGEAGARAFCDTT